MLTLSRFLAFSIRHVTFIAEQAQVDTFLTCGLPAEAIGHMADTFVRHYLIV